MKKIWTLALSLVLTAAMFTGCGCTNTEKDDASTPTGMTEPAATIAPTQPSTVPTTQATRPTMEETTPTGNGAMEDATSGMTGTTDATETMPQGRSGNGMGGNAAGGNGIAGSGNTMPGGISRGGNSGR